MSTLIRRLTRGAIAGAAGTVAMDLFWYRGYRERGGEQPFARWAFSSGIDSFEDAGPPAQLAEKLAERLGVELPERAAGTVSDVVHWLTGTGYGALVQGLVIHDRRNPAASALATGGVAWLNAYVTLGAVGLYKPIWEYDRKTLAKDLTAHLAYGAGTALTYRALSVLDSSR